MAEGTEDSAAWVTERDRLGCTIRATVWASLIQVKLWPAVSVELSGRRLMAQRIRSHPAGLFRRVILLPMHRGPRWAAAGIPRQTVDHLAGRPVVDLRSRASAQTILSPAERALTDSRRSEILRADIADQRTATGTVLGTTGTRTPAISETTMEIVSEIGPVQAIAVGDLQRVLPFPQTRQQSELRREGRRTLPLPRNIFQSRALRGRFQPRALRPSISPLRTCPHHTCRRHARRADMVRVDMAPAENLTAAVVPTGGRKPLTPSSWMSRRNRWHGSWRTHSCVLCRDFRRIRSGLLDTCCGDLE